MGPFASSAHFPRVLSLFLRRAPFLFALLGFLASGVKFTNPYGASRISNERASLSFSSILALRFSLLFYALIYSLGFSSLMK